MHADTSAGLVILASAVLLLLFGGLPSPEHLASHLDAAFWPYLLAGLLGLFGAVLAAQGFLRSRRIADATSRRMEDTTSGQMENATSEPPPIPARVIARNVAVIVAYIPVLYVLGFYATGFAFALTGPPLFGDVRWRTSALFAVTFTAVLWVVFTVLLGMDLPAGYLNFQSLATGILIGNPSHA